MERLGTTSLTTRETLQGADGEVAAEARVTTVRWDQDARAALRFTDGQRARLAEFGGLDRLGPELDGAHDQHAGSVRRWMNGESGTVNGQDALQAKAI